MCGGGGVSRAHSEEAVIAHACHVDTHSSYQLGCLSRTDG